MTEERILDRVRKLLALANDQAATEGERDNALRMAYATLAKYELDMEDVKGHERDKMDPREKHMMEGWNLVWCRDMRRHVANLFMCKYVIGKKINATRGQHHFIGRASAVTTTMMMSDWIIASVLKEADKRYKHRLTPDGRSFCIGVTDEVGRRVHELRVAQQESYKEVGSGLVVMDMVRSEEEANLEFMQANMKTRQIKARATSFNPGSYGDGRAHGQNINLNTQLGNKKGTLAIGGK